MKTVRADAPRRKSRNLKRRLERPPAPFHAFIAYADVAAGREAMNTISDVLHDSRRPFVLAPMLWRFEQLRGGRLRETALVDAMQADVVVFASTDRGPLPGFVERWIGEFLARKRGARVTAVALLGTEEAWTISIEPTAEEDTSAAAAFPLALAALSSRAA